MIEFCPRCRVSFVRDPHSGDFVHTCNSNSNVSDQEDVLRIGNWEDYTGSGTVNSWNYQSAEDKLMGTRAWHEGERLESMSARGKSIKRFRQRQYEKYIP